MKSNFLVLWIAIMMLFSTGVSLSVTSSQASDLQVEAKGRNCKEGMVNDKVIGIRLDNLWNNIMWFDVDLSIDESHYAGTDGIDRQGRLQHIRVIVLPFDQNGNRLWTEFQSGSAGLSGTSVASVKVTFKAGDAIGQLVDLLVVVEEVNPAGDAFRFCKLWKYANVYMGSATSEERRIITNPITVLTLPRTSIVGKIMSKKDYNIVYTYFNNGTFAVGEFLSPLKFIKTMNFALPEGREPLDIVGMALAKNDRVFTWFNDGKYIEGSPTDLSFYTGTPRSYSLPPNKSPNDIIGMAIDPQDLIYTWFKDGLTCTGTPYDLDKYASPSQYTPVPDPKKPIFGMAISYDYRVFTWREKAIYIGSALQLDQKYYNLNVLTGGP